MAITASDFSVASNGDLRSIAGSTIYTALELHAWLQDLADNPAPTADDQVSILGANPSELAGKRNALRPMAITLLNGINVDDATSRRFKFGSIEQQNGQVLYTGLKTIGTVPGDASIYIVQNNAKINGGTKWWPAGPIQTMVKAKAAGTLIAGNTVAGVAQAAGYATVFARQFGRTYSHFDVDLGPGSEQQAALSISTDSSITLSAAAAQAKFADITIAIGDTTQSLGGISKLYNGTITLANGITVAEAYQALQWATSESSTATINALRPQVRDIVKAPTTDWTTEDKLERKRAWVDSSGALKEIVDEPKFPLRYEDGLFKNVYALDSKNAAVLVPAPIIARE